MAASAADEISLSRAALRDGLWSVARVHAAKACGARAEEIILESFARQGKWAEVRDAAAAAATESDGVRYYRLLADYRLGEKPDPAKIVPEEFVNEDYRTAVRLLKAELLWFAGDYAAALPLVKSLPEADQSKCEVRLFLAELEFAGGARGMAEVIWRDLIASTNASDIAVADAAARLGDEQILEGVTPRLNSATAKRTAGLALARLQLAKADTFETGAKSIRALVCEAPDFPGAREMFLFLADAFISERDFKSAAQAFADALEMWPDCAKSAAVQSGRGWSFAGLGRDEEALAAFRLAETFAQNPDEKAMAAVKVGDQLSRLGRRDESMLKYREVLKLYADTPAAKRTAEIVRIREAEKSGRQLFLEYRFSEAEQRFKEVAAADPLRRARMEYCLMLCLYGQGRDKEAAAAAKKLSLDCEDPTIRGEAKFWLAKYSFNAENWADAGRLFFEYASELPDSSAAATALLWSARAAFAANDHAEAIQRVSRLVTIYPESPAAVQGAIVQGEALIELGRFDEAVLALERAADNAAAEPADRMRARLLRADAFYALGADNSARYEEALAVYRTLRQGEQLTPSMEIQISAKIGMTLEKLKRFDEAIDQYYTQVVLAYRDGRLAGRQYDEEARAAFSRSAFRLADEHESRGQNYQAIHILELVVKSDVPAAAEAERRSRKLQMKGDFL